MNHPADDLYAVLGLPRTASAADVKRAYRQQALAWHPDKRPGDCGARFKLICLAHEVLTNSESRARYDAEGIAVPDDDGDMPRGCHGSAAADLFRDFFGSPTGSFAGGGGPLRQQQQQHDFFFPVACGGEPFAPPPSADGHQPPPAAFGGFSPFPDLFGGAMMDGFFLWRRVPAAINGAIAAAGGGQVAPL